MDAIPPPTRQDMVAMLVTEHFTLQGARSATISDANGRTSFFLGTLSAVTVALAFVAQISGMGDAFFVFAMVLLPTLLFIGLASFERLLQLGIENIRCVVAINRIRHYYLEVAPELRAHFTLSPHDDTQGVLTSLGSLRGNVRAWDIFVTNAGMVAVVNGIIAGVVGALIAWQLRLGMGATAAIGLLVGIGLLAILVSYLARSWQRSARIIGSRFPTRGEELDLSHLAPSAEE
jgi:hypothetical protein